MLMFIRLRVLCLFVIMFAFYACKSPHAKVLEFSANKIYPGRSEQMPYYNLNLKIIMNKENLNVNNVQIMVNEKYLVPSNIIQQQYKKGDTVNLVYAFMNNNIKGFDFYLIGIKNNKRIKIIPTEQLNTIPKL